MKVDFADGVRKYHFERMNLSDFEGVGIFAAQIEEEGNSVIAYIAERHGFDGCCLSFVVSEPGVDLFGFPVVGKFTGGTVFPFTDFGAKFQRTEGRLVERTVVGVVQVEEPAEEGVHAAVSINLEGFHAIECCFARDEIHFSHIGIDTGLVADHVGQLLTVGKDCCFCFWTL